MQSLMGIASSVGMKDAEFDGDSKLSRHEKQMGRSCWCACFSTLVHVQYWHQTLAKLIAHSEIRIRSCSTSASNICSQHWFTISSNALHTVTSILCPPLSILQKNMVWPLSFVVIAVRMSIHCMAGSGTKQVQSFLPCFVLQWSRWKRWRRFEQFAFLLFQMQTGCVRWSRLHQRPWSRRSPMTAFLELMSDLISAMLKVQVRFVGNNTNKQ